MPTLDRLPFDVLYFITSNLYFDDITNLSHTCRQLKGLLQEGTLCRRTIEAHYPYTKEARLAQDQHISYCDAVSSIHDRRNAFANAHPFSARVIGYGNDFCCRQGVLCILEGNVIRVLDMKTSSDALQIDLSSIIVATPEASMPSGETRTSLLYFSDDIITVRHERKSRPANGRIYVISTKRNPPNGNRVLKVIPLDSGYKLFARHTARHLYYGTYTAMGDHGHHEWQIFGVTLNNQDSPLPCVVPVQLLGFFGTDIGSTIAFEIHNDYFYAVSNQTSFEVEEIDWTSFYHCIRFPLGEPKQGKVEVNKRVYRRQHIEGPIHDSWTDLTLQFDESTDKVMIVESRREWQKSSSRQLRTFYVSDFKWKPDSASTSTDGSPIFGASAAPMLPANDRFTELLDSSNNPNYAPVQPRFNWNYHPEFASSAAKSRSFILARTKFRAYNYSCSSFLDLVEDERCCGESVRSPCMRIRIGTRRMAPSDWTPPDDAIPSKGSTPVVEDDVAYRSSSIKMWPPPSSRCPCSKRLHAILNPSLPSGPAYSRSITGVLDERSLVYMIRSGRSYSPGDDNALGVIVMVNFDRDSLASTPNHTRSTDHEGAIEIEPSASHWRWTPGACKVGAC